MRQIRTKVGWRPEYEKTDDGAGGHLSRARPVYTRVALELGLQLRLYYPRAMRSGFSVESRTQYC